MWNPFRLPRIIYKEFDKKPVEIHYDIDYDRNALNNLSQEILFTMRYWRLAKYFPRFEIHFVENHENGCYAYVKNKDAQRGEAIIYMCIPKVFEYLDGSEEGNRRHPADALRGLFDHELSHPFQIFINSHYHDLKHLSMAIARSEKDTSFTAMDRLLRAHNIKFEQIKNSKITEIWIQLEKSFVMLHGESIAEFNNYLEEGKTSYTSEDINRWHKFSERHAHQTDNHFREWISSGARVSHDELKRDLELMPYRIGIHVAQIVMNEATTDEQIRAIRMHPAKYLNTYEHKAIDKKWQPLVAESHHNAVLVRSHMAEQILELTIKAIESWKTRV